MQNCYATLEEVFTVDASLTCIFVYFHYSLPIGCYFSWFCKYICYPCIQKNSQNWRSVWCFNESQRYLDSGIIGHCLSFK